MTLFFRQERVRLIVFRRPTVRRSLKTTVRLQKMQTMIVHLQKVLSPSEALSVHCHLSVIWWGSLCLTDGDFRADLLLLVSLEAHGQRNW